MADSQPRDWAAFWSLIEASDSGGLTELLVDAHTRVQTAWDRPSDDHGLLEGRRFRLPSDKGVLAELVSVLGGVADGLRRVAVPLPQWQRTSVDVFREATDMLRSCPAELRIAVSAVACAALRVAGAVLSTKPATVDFSSALLESLVWALQEARSGGDTLSCILDAKALSVLRDTCDLCIASATAGDTRIAPSALVDAAHAVLRMRQSTYAAVQRAFQAAFATAVIEAQSALCRCLAAYPPQDSVSAAAAVLSSDLASECVGDMLDRLEQVHSPSADRDGVFSAPFSAYAHGYAGVDDGNAPLFERILGLAASASAGAPSLVNDLLISVGTLSPRDVDEHYWNETDASPLCTEYRGLPSRGLSPSFPATGESFTTLKAASRAVSIAVALPDARASWSPIAVAVMTGAARSVFGGDVHVPWTGVFRARLAALLLSDLYEAGGLRLVTAFTLLAQPETYLEHSSRRFISVWHEALTRCLESVADVLSDPAHGASMQVASTGLVTVACRSESAVDSLNAAMQLLELCSRVVLASFGELPQQDGEILCCTIVGALVACTHSLVHSSIAIWLVCNTLLRIAEGANVDAIATALSNARGVPLLLRLTGMLVDRVSGSTPAYSAPHRATAGVSVPRWPLPLRPWIRDAPERVVRTASHPDLDDDYFAEGRAVTEAKPSVSTLASPALKSIVTVDAATTRSGWGGGAGSGLEVVPGSPVGRGSDAAPLFRAALFAIVRVLHLQLGRDSPSADVHRAVLLCQLNSPPLRNVAPRIAPQSAPESGSAKVKPTQRASAATHFKTCGIRFGTHAPLGPLFSALASRPLRDCAIAVIEQLSLTTERLLEGSSPAFEALAMSLTYPRAAAPDLHPAKPGTERGPSTWATFAVGLFSGAPVGEKEPRSAASARWLSECLHAAPAPAAALRPACLGGLALDLPWCLGLRDEMTVVIDAEAQASGALSPSAAPSRSALLASLNPLLRQGRTLVAAAFRLAIASLVPSLRTETDPRGAVTILTALTHTTALAHRVIVLPPSAGAAPPAALAAPVTLLAWLAECDRHRADQQGWLLGAADGSADGVSVVRALVGALDAAVAAAHHRGCYSSACCAVASGIDLLSVLTFRNARATSSFQRSGGVRRLAAWVGPLLGRQRGEDQTEDDREHGATCVVEALLRYVTAGNAASGTFGPLARMPPLCPPIMRPEAAVALLAALEGAPQGAQETGLRGLLSLLTPTRGISPTLPSSAGALDAGAARNAQTVASSSAGVLHVALSFGESISSTLAPLLLDLTSALLPFAVSPTFVRELARAMAAPPAPSVPRFSWAVFERLVRATCLEKSPSPSWARSAPEPRATGSSAPTETLADLPDYAGPVPSSFFSMDSEMSGLRVVTQRADGTVASGLPLWPGSGRANSGPVSALSFSFHCWVCIRSDGHVVVRSSEQPDLQEPDMLAACAAKAAAAHASRAVAAGSLPSTQCAAPVLDCVGESPTLLYVADDGGRNLSLSLVAMLRAGAPLSPGDVAAGRRPAGFMLQFRVAHQRRGHETLEAPGAMLRYDRWYAVGLTHEKPAASLLARGLSSLGVNFAGHHATAKLFINGVCVGLGTVGYPNFGTNVVDLAPGAVGTSSPTTPRVQAAQWLLPCAGGASSDLTWDALQATYRGTRETSAAQRSIAGGVQCVFGAGREGEVVLSREVRSIEVPFPASAASASPTARLHTVSVAVDVRVHVCTHLHGALSSVMLFDTALPPDAMCQLWTAGPSAPVSFAGTLTPARLPSGTPAILNASVASLGGSVDAANSALGGKDAKPARAKSVVPAVQDPAVTGRILAAFDPTVRVHRGSGSESQVRVLFSNLVPRAVSSQHPSVCVPVVLVAGSVEPAWAEAVAAALVQVTDNSIRAPQISPPPEASSPGVALFVEALPGTSVVRRRSLRASVMPHSATFIASLLSSAVSIDASAAQKFPVDSIIDLLASLTATGPGLATPGSPEAGEAGELLALQLDLCGSGGAGLVALSETLRRLPLQCLSMRTVSAYFQWVSSLPANSIDRIVTGGSVESASGGLSASALFQCAVRTGIRDIAKASKMAGVVRTEVLKTCLFDRQTWCRPRVPATVLLHHARALLAFALSSPDSLALLRESVGFVEVLDILGQDYPSWRRALRDDDGASIACYRQARDTLWSLLRFTVTADREFSLHRRIDSAAPPPWAAKGCVPVFAASELHAIFFALAAGRTVAHLRHPLTLQQPQAASAEWLCVVEGTAIASASGTAPGHSATPRARAFADAHTAETLEFMTDFLKLGFCGARICEQLSSAQFCDHLKSRQGHGRFSLNEQVKMLTRTSPGGAISSAASPALQPLNGSARVVGLPIPPVPPAFRLDCGASVDVPLLPRIRLVSDAAFDGSDPVATEYASGVEGFPVESSPVMASLASPPIASFAMQALLTPQTTSDRTPFSAEPSVAQAALPDDAHSVAADDDASLESCALHAAALVARRVAMNPGLYGGPDLIVRLLMSPAAAVRVAALAATLHLLRLAKSVDVAVGSGFNFSTLATITEAQRDTAEHVPGVALSPLPFSYAFASSRVAPFSCPAHLLLSLPAVQRRLRGNPFSAPTPSLSDESSQRLRVPAAVVVAFNSAASRVFFSDSAGGEALDRSLASMRSQQRVAIEDDDESEGESSAAGGSAALAESTARSAAVRSGRPPRPPSQMTTAVTRYGRQKPSPVNTTNATARLSVRPPTSGSAASVPMLEGDGLSRSFRSSSGSLEHHATAISAFLEHPSVKELAGGLLDNVRARTASVSGGAGRAESVISSVSANDPRTPPAPPALPTISARCLFTGAPSSAHVLAACELLTREFSSDEDRLLQGARVTGDDAAEDFIRVVLQAMERAPGNKSSRSVPAAFTISDASLVPLLLSLLARVGVPVDYCCAILQALLAGLSNGDSASRVVQSCADVPLQWMLPALRLVCRCYAAAAVSVISSGAAEDDSDPKTPWETCACSAVRVLAALHAADIRRPLGSNEPVAGGVAAAVSKLRGVASWSLAGFRSLLASLLLLQAAATGPSSSVIASLPSPSDARMVLPGRYRYLAASQLLCGVTLRVKLVDSMGSTLRSVGAPAASPAPRAIPPALQRASSSRSSLLTRQSSDRGGFAAFPISAAAPSTPMRLAEECRRALFAGGDAPFIGVAGQPGPSTPRPQPQAPDAASLNATERLTPSQGVWLLGLLLADEATSISRLGSGDADEPPLRLQEAASEFWGAVSLWLQLGVLSGVAAGAALASATPTIVPCEPHERVAGGSARLAIALTMRGLLLCATGHRAAPSEADSVTLLSLLGEWTLWPATIPAMPLGRGDSSSSLPVNSAGALSPHPLQLLLASGLAGVVSLATPRSSGHLKALWLASVLDAVAPRLAPAGAAIASRLAAAAAVLPPPSAEADPTAAAVDAESLAQAAAPPNSAVDALRLQLVARLLGRANVAALVGRLSAVMECCETLLLHEPVYNRVVGRVRELRDEQTLSAAAFSSGDRSQREDGSITSEAQCVPELGPDGHGRAAPRQKVAPMSSLASTHMVGLRSTEDAVRAVLQVVEVSANTPKHCGHLVCTHFSLNRRKFYRGRQRASTWHGRRWHSASSSLVSARLRKRRRGLELRGLR